MCFSGGGKTKPAKTFEPASAPAPPLPVAEEPDIRQRRRNQNIQLFGKDTPSYRHRDEADNPAQPADASASRGGLRM